MKLLAIFAGIGAAAWSIFGRKNKSVQMHLSSDLSEPEMRRYLHKAEKLLGKKFKGPYLAIRTEPGTRPSSAPGWKGVYLPMYGVALGTFAPWQITLYTTNGRYRPETARWEMGRAILWCHGTSDEREARRTLEMHGFRD